MWKQVFPQLRYRYSKIIRAFTPALFIICKKNSSCIYGTIYVCSEIFCPLYLSLDLGKMVSRFKFVALPFPLNSVFWSFYSILRAFSGVERRTKSVVLVTERLLPEQVSGLILTTSGGSVSSIMIWTYFVYSENVLIPKINSKKLNKIF